MSADFPAVADESVDDATRGALRSRMRDWLCRTEPAVQNRLYWALRTVSQRFSNMDSERFIEADPVVIDLDGSLGMVTRIARPDLPCRVPVICINVDAGDLLDTSYEGLVGHEVAHVVLGHLESRRSQAEKHEEVAKKLAEWGLSDRPVVAPGGGEYLLLQTLKGDLDAALVELSYGLEEANLDDLSDTLAECIRLVNGLVRRHQALRACARTASGDAPPVRPDAADAASVVPALTPTAGEGTTRPQPRGEGEAR